jgi:membrane protease YdiL (CAAX protease family)
MLFLLKRTTASGLVGLIVLAAIGLTARHFLGDRAVPLAITGPRVLAGFGVCAAVVFSDGLLHGLLGLMFGERYQRRFREMADIFRGQSDAAILTGAAMAGVGEELVFRGLGTAPLYLVTAAILFGLLHHLGRPLWPFTIWSIWEGLLLAGAVSYFGDLAVSMVAHFLHDVIGFLIFRSWNRRTAPPDLV